MSKRDRKKRYAIKADVEVKPVGESDLHGFPRADVEEMASMGAKFNPRRNSFMFDLEGDLEFLQRGGKTP